MFDQSFLDFVEYKVCDALNGSGLWCDGVMSPKYLKDQREIWFAAFVGKDGQSEYELILRLGDKSLSRYTRNLDIKECWPEGDSQDWFYIDPGNARMIIQLD